MSWTMLPMWERMQKLTVPVETVAVSFKDDATFICLSAATGVKRSRWKKEHGEVVSVSYLPENATELDMILRRERFKTGFHAKTGSIEDHIHKLAVQHGVTEKLGILPLKRRPPTMPSRKPIPKRLSALPRTATSRFTVKMRRRQRPRSAQSS